jgi:hypothetical protein
MIQTKAYVAQNKNKLFLSNQGYTLTYHLVYAMMFTTPELAFSMLNMCCWDDKDFTIREISLEFTDGKHDCSD